ncbi:MAG: hypothetical protein H6R18_244 [Proteobacteria bacterium]|nr:hypothetical protein [Pseudomonadota bacterium]
MDMADNPKKTREPVVAGRFYPNEPQTLASEISRLLDSVVVSDTRQPKAIIAPHAGYIYSGRTAAAVYTRIKPWRGTIHRVILLGPSHHTAVAGLALPSVDAFATPLRSIPLDQQAMSELRALPQVVVSDAAHASEHSLEVQLPFLQSVLESFTLVPLAVGQVQPESVAEVLEAVWGGDETLIVVSSDLSHFLPYASARVRDRMTCDAILDCDPSIDPHDACGAHPINGLLLAATRHNLTPELVELCNSGDTAGDKSAVVGYAAFAFYPESSVPA